MSIRSNTRRHSCFAAPLLAAVLASTSLPVHASEPADTTDTLPPESAEELRQQARAAYAEDNYAEAIDLFEQAHELDPVPTDVFNIGRIHEARGDLREALLHYEQFVRFPRLSLEERKAATDRIEVLRVAIQPTTEPEPAEARPQPQPRPPLSEPTPKRDTPPEGRGMIIAGGVLIASGAALAVGAGVGFGLRARRASDKVDGVSSGSNPDRLSLSEAEDLDAEGKDAEILQISLGAAGGVIAATGIGLLVAGLIRQKRSRLQALHPVVGPRFAGINASWRF
jgi:tetratricopeptide (TPR) repeat protein